MNVKLDASNAGQSQVDAKNMAQSQVESQRKNDLTDYNEAVLLVAVFTVVFFSFMAFGGDGPLVDFGNLWVDSPSVALAGTVVGGVGGYCLYKIGEHLFVNLKVLDPVNKKIEEIGEAFVKKIAQYIHEKEHPELYNPRYREMQPLYQ